MSSKRTWTKKAFLLTDGESVLETDDWENTVQKMNDLRVLFNVIGVDFDDPEMGFKEENKSRIKVHLHPPSSIPSYRRFRKPMNSFMPTWCLR